MNYQDTNHDLINKDKSSINDKSDIINGITMDDTGFGLNGINDHHNGNDIIRYEYYGIDWWF